VRAAGAALLTGVVPSTAFAEPWPTRPVRMVSPSAGGITDLHARIIAEKLTTRLGQQFYVDGKPGVTGGISAQVAAQAPADGYTFLFIIASLIVTNPFVYEKLLYDVDRDFVPVAMMSKAGFAFLVRDGLTVRSMTELAAHIKAHPGKLTVGNIAPGSLAHLATELYLQAFDGKVELVPYRTMPQVVQDLARGDIDAFMSPIGEANPTVAGGKVRALAITTAARHESLPDVPTMIEQGYAGFDVYGWYGVLAPKKTPRPIIDRMNREIAAITSAPEYRERMISLGAIPGDTGTPEEFEKIYQAEARRWGALIRKLGIRLE
jgi:tripartite-type tricarboxylate transporter receptor subunit TctC